MNGRAGIWATIAALAAPTTGFAAAQEAEKSFAAATSVVQEPREGFGGTTSAPPIIADPAHVLPPLRAEVQTLQGDLSLLREDADPIRRERRRIRLALQRRAEEQVATVARTHAAAPDAKRTAGPWRLSVGNTAAKNRSPYPDRMLDARTISLPHPRGMHHDKRSDRPAK